MSERKATNRYISPDFDPSVHKSINGQNGVSHLRKKIRKDGMVIRIEIPFGIWCDGCQNLIGKGTRFNVIKRQIGTYYSTKIFEFEMNCKECRNTIKLQSDPKNTDYVVIQGGRRQHIKRATQKVVLGSKEVKDEIELLEKEQQVNEKIKKEYPSFYTLFIAEDSKSRDDFDVNYLLRKRRKKNQQSNTINGVYYTTISDDE